MYERDMPQSKVAENTSILLGGERVSKERYFLCHRCH